MKNKRVRTNRVDYRQFNAEYICYEVSGVKCEVGAATLQGAAL